jgi:hypothetical protein
MTMLAGAFSRRPGRPIPEATREALRRAISRDPDDERIVFSDDRVFLVKIDIGAYGEPGLQLDQPGSVSMLAGEPLLAGEADITWRTRGEDLARIHRGLDRRDVSPLRDAEGFFSVVHYDPVVPKLTLLADKLGLRPLYYFVDDERVIFASALRVLEQVDEIPKRMDLRGVTEMAVFGYAVGARTPYADVARLRAAEVLEVSASAVASSRYWRWNRIRPSRRPEGELLAEAYRRFTAAIGRRLRNDTATFAFLSGGLDSRCITAVLRDRNVAVHTVNLAPAGTQDQLFGAWFARRAGTIHEEFAPAPDVADPLAWLPSAVDLWAAVKRQRLQPPVERPGLVWSGAGGSSAVGHPGPHRRPVVELLRAGKLERAVEEFCRLGGFQLSPRLVRPELRALLPEIPKLGMLEELADLGCSDPGQSLYLFCLLNEDRWGVANIVEKIDVNRIEYQMPFFDSAFLETMLEIPVDLCFGHAAYVKWLEYFPPVVLSVPWQAYPGSVPCPVPAPPGLPSQWDQGHAFARDLRARHRRKLVEIGRGLLRSTSFPDQILNRRNFRLMAYAYRANLRDYGYAIQVADTYHTYWSASKRCATS